jgi:hypothetical protein
VTTEHILDRYRGTRGSAKDKHGGGGVATMDGAIASGPPPAAGAHPPLVCGAVLEADLRFGH